MRQQELKLQIRKIYSKKGQWEMSDKLKGKLWILLGAFVTYVPLAYWRFTEGEKSLYEQSSFFPHYFIMLLLAACTVGIQCMIASRFEERDSYHLLAHVSGTVILVTYVLIITVGMFFLNKESAEEIGVWFFSFAVLGAAVLLYETMMFLLNVLIRKVIKKFHK